jgi:hypothetical protein
MRLIWDTRFSLPRTITIGRSTSQIPCMYRSEVGVVSCPLESICFWANTKVSEDSSNPIIVSDRFIMLQKYRQHSADK